jgi:chemotaxis signal transduction protein
MNKETKDRILQERANKLAQIKSVESGVSETLEFIAFSISAQKFLLKSDVVIEVVHFKDFARLPGVSKKLAGVYNFRGIVIGVFKGEELLGVKTDVKSNERFLIICGNNTVHLAITCEEVTGFERRDVSSLMNSTSLEILAPIFSGIFQDSARLINFERLIKDDSLNIL